MRHDDYRHGIPIKGDFGQGKNTYGLGKIQVKTAKTSFAWINSLFNCHELVGVDQGFLFACD